MSSSALDGVFLRVTNWALFASETLSYGEGLVASQDFDPAAYLREMRSAFSRGGHLQPSSISQDFGKLGFADELLIHRIRNACADPEHPTTREMSDLFRGSAALREHYALTTRKKHWLVSSRRRHGPITRRSVTCRPWSAAFELNESFVSFDVSGSEILAFLGLFQFLNGTCGQKELIAKFPADTPLVRRFLRFCEKNALLADGRDFRSADPGSRAGDTGFTFLSHSAIRIQDKDASLLIDPAFRLELGSKFPDFDHFNRYVARFGSARATLYSHNHWDHVHLPTMVRLPRSIPQYVPKVRKATPFNPQLKPYLSLLGFNDIREARNWKKVEFGSLSFTPFPFYGEWFGPKSSFDGFCYALEVGHKVIVGTVDADRNESGDMVDVLRALNRRFPKVDYLFFCSSGQFHQGLSCGAPFSKSNAYARKYSKNMRYHPDARCAKRYIEIIRPRFAIPYAEFLFNGEVESTQLSWSEKVHGKSLFDAYWKRPTVRRLLLRKDKTLVEWRRSLGWLLKSLSGKGTTLMMIGPGDSVGASTASGPRHRLHEKL
jgi:hypothetical protein